MSVLGRTGREGGLRVGAGATGGPTHNANSIAAKLNRVPWFSFFTLFALAAIGVMVLYSSTLNDPTNSELPIKHAQRFLPVAIAAIVLALVPLKIWAVVAFPAYIGALLLLVATAFFGVTGGGAERWLELGPLRVQPSEFMKLSLTLALARYYHWALLRRERSRTQATRRSAKKSLMRTLFLRPFLDLGIHIPAILLIMVPAALVLMQPDLGTALILLATGFAIMVFAGFNLLIIAFAILAQMVGVFVVPVFLHPDVREEPAAKMGFGSLAYYYVLEDYQRARVDSMLDPASDPLGAGYQAEQARIAIGSGGWDGKGYLGGTQSHLDYIPEQHTDFIFTALAEEFGFLGASLFLLAWAVLLGNGLWIANGCRSLFGKFAAGGAVVTVAFYVAFNIGMVLSLLPVVGVPLPLISYGGTAMLTLMACFGLVMAVKVHRDETVN